MTVTLIAAAARPELVAPELDTPRVSGLDDAQFAVVRSAVGAALGDLSVQFRRATPFSPIRCQLRETIASLHAVLAGDDVSAASAGDVIEVLTDRADRLRGQLRRCDTPDFAQQLRLEEDGLRAAAEYLSHRFAV